MVTPMTHNKFLPTKNYLEKAHYDKLYYATKGNKTPRFETINPEKVRSLFAGRPSYDYVKQLALEHLHQTLGEQLKFLIKINYCEDRDSAEMEKLSHNVFSWSYEDFLRRRHLENCVWVEVMIRNSTTECLEKQKVQADLKEVKHFVDMFFKAMTKGLGGKVDLEKCVWKPLRDVQDYLNVPEIIKANQVELQNTLKDVKDRLVMENVAEHLDEQRNRLLALEDNFMNSDVWDPIEVRYEINWYHSMVKQNQYKLDLILSGFENEIDKLKMKLITEKDCGGSIMDSYYSEVEQYKRRINHFQERYDFEFERYDNKNSYIQAQIDKLRDTKKFLVQEIKRFHTEIQQSIEKEERQRLAAELKKQEEEAAALALLEAKKLKERQKAKAKVGPKAKMVKTK